jgi:hypothetical protein
MHADRRLGFMTFAAASSAELLRRALLRAT